MEAEEKLEDARKVARGAGSPKQSKGAGKPLPPAHEDSAKKKGKRKGKLEGEPEKIYAFKLVGQKEMTRKFLIKKKIKQSLWDKFRGFVKKE